MHSTALLIILLVTETARQKGTAVQGRKGALCTIPVTRLVLAQVLWSSHFMVSRYHRFTGDLYDNWQSHLRFAIATRQTYRGSVSGTRAPAGEVYSLV
jgi:hypothetical protein